MTDAVQMRLGRLDRTQQRKTSELIVIKTVLVIVCGNGQTNETHENAS
jgi:hypothetical protein